MLREKEPLIGGVSGPGGDLGQGDLGQWVSRVAGAARQVGGAVLGARRSEQEDLLLRLTQADLT